MRVLGSLLEKEVTTPDNYPLSLNALLGACNQTTSRDPVMRLDEDPVIHATVALRRRGLLRQIQPAGSRVTKFEHLLGEEMNLGRRELAVLGVLMLRGPQTPGELYARTERLEPFADLAGLEGVLESLMAREPEPLVARLPRRPGQKEVRYAHLLGGEPPADAAGTAEARGVSPRRAGVDDDRVAALERTWRSCGRRSRLCAPSSTSSAPSSGRAARSRKKELAAAMTRPCSGPRGTVPGSTSESAR